MSDNKPAKTFAVSQESLNNLLSGQAIFSLSEEGIELSEGEITEDILTKARALALQTPQLVLVFAPAAKSDKLQILVSPQDIPPEELRKWVCDFAKIFSAQTVSINKIQQSTFVATTVDLKAMLDPS